MSLTPSPTVRPILAALRGVKPTADGWNALCPLHEADGQAHKPSLRITQAGDGTVLLKCRAGCPTPGVLAALGLTLKDLFPQPAAQNRIVAQYDYRDETSLLLYQAVRFEPKDFRQRAPKPGGGWEWKLNGARRVLYRLPELLAADAGQPVFIPEGEKDVERLRSLGFVATCNVGGAGKWRNEYNAALRGRPVVVIPDNDEPGRKHAEQIATALEGTAAAVRVLTLDGLPPKGDVSDWLNAGHTADELRQRAAAAPEWRRAAAPAAAPDVAKSARLSVVTMNTVKREPIDWIWPGKIARGKTHQFSGMPGVGKSTVGLEITARITRGWPWPDGSGDAPLGDVLFFVGEDSLADTIGPRLDEAGADSSRVHVVRCRTTVGETGQTHDAPISIGTDVDLFRDELSRRPEVAAVFFDPISEYMPGVNAHKDNEVRAALAPLARLAEDFGVAVISIGHFNKGNAGPAIYRAMGSVAFTAYARLAWAFIKDHEDDGRVLMLPLKSNVGRKSPGLAYRILEGDTAGKVEWEEHGVDISADEAIAGPEPGTKSKLTEAVDWLKTRLATGCVESHQLEQDAEAAGIAVPTLWRARKRLGVRAVKSQGKHSQWFVSLPNTPDEDLDCLDCLEDLDDVRLKDPQGNQDPQDHQDDHVSRGGSLF